ncbi:hypothetical protein V2J09_006211 [Rumex salicifolius]
MIDLLPFLGEVVKIWLQICLTLIARRSLLHADKGFLKCGLNEEGQASNDVEIEQIFCGGFHFTLDNDMKYKMWEMVRPPDSILRSLSKDMCGENPRQSLLGDGFHEALDTIKASLEKATQLEFIRFDLDGFFQTEGTLVLNLLKKVTEEVLDCTGFFSYEVLPTTCKP